MASNTPELTPNIQPQPDDFYICSWCNDPRGYPIKVYPFEYSGDRMAVMCCPNCEFQWTTKTGLYFYERHKKHELKERAEMAKLDMEIFVGKFITALEANAVWPEDFRV